MNKSTYQISKEVALLVAGAMIGIAAIPFQVKILDNLFNLVVALVVLMLYGIGTFGQLVIWLYWIVNKVNQKLHFICIYAPYEIEPKNSSWVDLSLKKLEKILQDNDIKCRISKTEGAFKEYPVIINPYGGSYPELDFSALQSLRNMIQYVRNGGVYINIADIPFYYAYDESLKRRIDTTPLAGNFSFERSFLKTILTQKLNHYVFGLTQGKDFDNGVIRVIQLTETSENLYDKDRFDNGPQGSFSPVLKIPFGRGCFIFSTLNLTQENFENNIMRVVRAAIR